MASNVSLGVGVVIGAALGASAGRTFRSAERRTARLGEAIGQTRLRAGRLERAHETLGRQVRRTGDAAGGLAAGHARLGRAIDRTRRRLDGCRGDLRRTEGTGRVRGGAGRTSPAAGAVARDAGAAGRSPGGAREREEAAARLRIVLVTDAGRALEDARELVRSRAARRGETEVLNVRYVLDGAGLEASSARVGAAVVSTVATVTRGAPERAAATAFDDLGGAPAGGFARRGEGTSTAASAAGSARTGLVETAVGVGGPGKVGRPGGEAGAVLGVVVRRGGPASDEPGRALVRLLGADGERGRRGPVAAREGLDAAPGRLGACAAPAGAAPRAFGGGGKAAPVPGRVPGDAPATRERAECAAVVVVRLGEAVEGSGKLKKSLVAVAQGVVTTIVVEAGRKLIGPRGIRFGAGRAGGGAAGGAKGGARAAGQGIARMGGALKMLGRTAALALGVVGFKVVAVGALIAGAVLLVRRYWEPVTGFFRGLWGRVTAVFKPVVEAWGKVFTDFSWANVGRAVMETLALGIRGAVGAPAAALKTVLGKVRDYLPFSDARTGPLSALTASGGALLRTVGDGVRRAGPDGLRRPLARGLAAASTVLALAPPTLGAAAPAMPPPAPPPALGAAASAMPPPAMPPAPAPAAPRPAASVADNRRIYVTIQQQPREDAAALVDRLLAEIERRDGVRRRAALHDEV